MEPTVQMLCDMGFPRAQVEQCLRAAFNNPDRAVEYLMSGIPPNLQAAAAPPQPAPAPAGPGAQVLPPNPFAAGVVAPPPAGAPAATGPLAELKNHPHFNTLKMAVQQSPQALNQVLSVINQSSPQLVQLMAEHQAEFVQILQEPVVAPQRRAAQDPVAAMLAAAQAAQAGQGHSGGTSAFAGPGGAPQASGAAPTPAPQLTAAQNSAVDRIAGLGFPREMALAAYLACDMNEDVAANMMFDVDDGSP